MSKENPRTRAALIRENDELRHRLGETEQMLAAIRHGGVDAIVVSDPRGESIYTLTGAEHAYRVIVETMNEAALTAGPDGTILYCNQRFCDLMRTPMHEALGRRVTEFVAAPQQAPLETVLADAQSAPVRRHLTLRAADGTAVPVLLSAGPLHTPDGADICLVASDLTELEESTSSIRVLREHRQALEESEERYRRFFMEDLTGDFLATPDGRLIECNPAFAEIYGFDSPDAAAQYDVSQSDPSGWLEVLKRIRERGKIHNYESWHTRPDGMRIYIVANLVGAFDDKGELTAIKGYVFEDTARKVAMAALDEANLRLQAKTDDLAAINEQLLTQQEELQRQTLELREMKEAAERTAREMEWLARIPKESPDPILRVSQDYTVLYANPAAGELCRHWNCRGGQRVPTAIRELILAAWVRQDVVRHEYIRGNRTYMVTVAPSAALDYAHVYTHDVTERKTAERALRESEGHLRQAAEAAHFGIYDADFLTGSTYISPEMREILGLPAGAQVPQTWGHVPNFVRPDDAESLQKAMNAAYDPAGIGVLESEHRIIRPDGAVRWIMVRGQVQFDGDGDDRRPIRSSGTVLDITERKQAQEALRESEQRLKLAQKAAHIGVFDWDMIHDKSVWTDEFCTIFGLNPQDCNRPAEAWQRIISPEERARVEQEFYAAAAERRTEFATEYRILRPDGAVAWVANMVTITYNDAGRAIRMIGVALDITERKEAENIRRIKDYAIASSLNAIVIADLQGRLTYVNDAFLTLWGYENRREVLGIPVLDLWEEPERARDVVQAIQSRKGWIGELTAVRKDGTNLILYLSASMVFDDAGAPLCMMASFMDITDRKRAEQERERQFQMLRETFDQLPAYVTLYRGSAHVMEYGNPQNADLWGGRDPVGKPIREGYPEIDPRYLEAWDQVYRTGGPVRFLEAPSTVVNGDGTRGGAYFDLSLLPRRDDQGNVIGVMGFGIDITERKQAEEALRESRRRLELAADVTEYGAFDYYPQTGELIWSDHAKRHFGLGPDAQVNYDVFLKGLHPDDRERVDRIVQDVMRPDSGGLYRTEYRTIGIEDGKERWLSAMGRVYFDEAGRPVRFIGATLDITDRKRVEESLRDSETRLRLALDAGRMGTWVWDLATDTVDTDLLHRRLWDLDDADVRVPVGVILQRIHPEDRALVLGTESAPYRLAEPFDMEFRMLRPDGSVRWLAGSAVPIRDADGVLRKVIGVNFDITERKRAEESLREFNRTLETRVAARTEELRRRAQQLQKLALELSQAEDRERKRMAEILHDDLQQQLAAVKFHVGILAGRARGDILLQKAAGQIETMLKDAVETSRNLSHELSPAVMYHGDLGEIFEWLANQVRIKHGLIVRVDIRGQIDTSSDALKIFLFKTVQEMLFNAVKHARVGEARVRVRRRGLYLCLMVSDRGRGFDPQGLTQAAGFGLMSIRERIGLLGGHMRIHSAVGVGSRFIITVPDGQMAEDEERARGRGPEAAGAAPALASRLRVLIADDHEIVRQGLASLLAEAKDVEVVGEAGNGREAVDQAYDLRPDVVIMDVAMPLMNGDEAARQIRKHLPQTRIVALSMHEEPGTVEKMHKAGAESYVLKTAPADELLAAVRGEPQ